MSPPGSRSAPRAVVPPAESSTLPVATRVMAKLHPPAALPTQVARARLVDDICAAASARVTLVRAPAGFGKTTLMAQARARLQDEGVATAWLTLDAADNDPTRFLACLGAALSMEATGGPGRPRSRGTAVAGLEVIDRLAAYDGAVVVFIDELEWIHETGVLGLLTEIIQRLPRHGRLVLGSRGLPDLAIGRLRARGQLLELDTDRLRFSLAETSEFLHTRRRLPLLAPDLAMLHRKTEGWVAALWLASLALERHDAHGDFIRRFSGSSGGVADYLADDVLSRQLPAVRTFLLRTSILRHLHAPLCDALMPEGASAAVLAGLDAANLFVTPIEGDDGTHGYRYHALFASFLKAQLARDFPDEVAGLHRAASDWYERQGRPVPAIDHAIEAGALDRALTLMSRHAEDLLAQGRLRLLTRWFAAVPETLLVDRPALQVVRAWALCFTEGPQDAFVLLERIRSDASTDPEATNRMLALRPALLAMMDDYAAAAEAGLHGLAHLPKEESFAYAVLSNAMAHIHFVHGRYPEARRQLDRAREAQGRHASRFNIMYSESVEGLIDLQEGRMKQAAARFRMAVHAAPGASGAGGNAWAGVLHALAVYESDDRVDAERLLHVFVPLARDVGLPDHMILGYSMLARLAFQGGDMERAFQWLIELEYLGHQRQLPRVAASAQLERTRILLLLGNTQAAADELARAGASDVWRRIAPFHLPTDVEDHGVGMLRFDAIAGDARRAVSSGAQQVAQSTAAGNHRRAIRLRLITTVALARTDAGRLALASLRDVLHLTCGEGMFRFVVDEGAALGRLVRELARAEVRDGLRDPLFADYLQRLDRAFDLPADDVSAADVSANTALPLDPLTPGEVRILQLLAEGDSNSAMASKLFVSDSTVRTHLRNINSKLDTASRTQAVAVARRLRLVS